MMNYLVHGIIDGVVQGKWEIYNPVFFYGDPVRVRLSVDRLVKAYTRAHPQDFIYRTNGVDFVCEWIHAIKEGTTLNYGGAIRKAKVLVFESVEVIAGKQSTMELFYSIFDAVYENGGAIIMGGLRPPSQIPGLEDRVRTQMEGGIICCVDNNRECAVGGE